MPVKQKTIDLSIPSILGYEKVAMDAAAAAAKIMGFHKSRVEDLKTAVAEACINAIEHGNRLQQNTTVLVTLKINKKSLEVNIKDQGKGIGRKIKMPKLEKQIAGAEDPRGWGMFLIKSLVDEMEIKNVPNEGTVTRMVIHVNR